MPDCKTLDRFATPYVDGELDAADRAAVDAHLSACAPCRSRLAAEQGVRALIHARHAALCSDAASAALRARCAAACAALGAAPRAAVPIPRPASVFQVWRARLAPLALAASVAVVVSIGAGGLLYEATDQSSRLMAAELTADHIKCFGLNRVLGTHDTATAVENAIASSFGLRLALPEQPEREGLELFGERPCLYGEGKIAHIMYRYNGRAVSVFMLPKTTRRDEIVDVMGHEAAIWSAGGRTFVLITREPRPEVERMATFVQASLH